jgi:hypothetical protein
LTLRIEKISVLEGVFASLKNTIAFILDFMDERDVRGIHLVD